VTDQVASHQSSTMLASVMREKCRSALSLAGSRPDLRDSASPFARAAFSGLGPGWTLIVLKIDGVPDQVQRVGDGVEELKRCAKPLSACSGSVAPGMLSGAK